MVKPIREGSLMFWLDEFPPDLLNLIERTRKYNTIYALFTDDGSYGHEGRIYMSCEKDNFYLDIGDLLMAYYTTR